jgi:hypothetical protein
MAAKEKPMSRAFWCIAVATGAVLAAGAAGAAEPPLAGCYERVYDAAHLSAHKGQIVLRATLSIAATKAGEQTGKADPVIADGVLKIWVRGQKQSFDSIGACRADGANFVCDGALSAAEADTCKSKHDGVRQCRIDSNDPGSFKVEARPEGVLVSVRERLELVPAPYDGGPYLYFSPNNAENHAFLLKKAPCK